MNLKILITAITTFLIFSNIALAIPVGHVFYGIVTLNGNPAPDGTTVSARLDGTELASTITSEGKYSHLTLSLDAAYSGRTIDFFVNGNQANENYQFCFDFACLTELDLTVTIETSSGTGNGGGGGGGGGGGTRGSEATTTTIVTQPTFQVCQEKWTCTGWSACQNGLQTRTCTDENNCGTRNNEPFSSQPCTTVEIEGETNPLTGLLTLIPSQAIIGLIALILIVVIFFGWREVFRKKTTSSMNKLFIQ